MKKIIVIGSCGAGKSTLARKLSKKLNIKLFHLDQLFWQPNWISTDRKFKIDTLNNILEQASWIIDGNYSSTLSIRVRAANTIIFLDINRFICIYHVLKRIIKYREKTRPDMQKDCPEKLDLELIQRIWKFPNKQRGEIFEMLKNVSDKKQVVILKNQKQINNFLNEL